MDDVQFTRRDWRNRNKIKTGLQTQWLTVPLKNKGNFGSARVMDMKVADLDWAEKHFTKLQEAYRSATFWFEISEFLYATYRTSQEFERLTDINHFFLVEMCKLLEIDHKISFSTDYFSLMELDEFDASDRLLALTKESNSTVYLSGPAAHHYLDTSIFKAQKIDVKFANYNVEESRALAEASFYNNFSIIDFLANYGIDKTRESLIKYRVKFVSV